ncbi:hypothetical protein SmJEL517_g02258 [Synchytrium microbalum]|uniref:Autophagy-related protein 14 n=1 Tax=Synchytrium microbalum TaxID=1806994 RepID=A0A507C159_9FUNG|nr:uncharacterized protein SmJEL517_g02258 [Synchytrium microbalum]TPX35250.1 hypothetical protein SmJEL517_g02258 [Synchytrium microbalum]
MQGDEDGGLECYICGSTHKRFHCTECLHDKIRSQKALSDSTQGERQRISDSITSKLFNRPQTGASFDKLYESKQLQIESLEADIARARGSIQSTRDKLQELRTRRESRRQTLANAAASLESGKAKSIPKKTSDLKERRDNAQSDSDSLVQNRHDIIRELVAVFRLRKVAARVVENGRIPYSNGATPVNGNIAMVPSPSSSSTSGSTSPITAATVLAGKAPPPEYKIVNVAFSSYGECPLQQQERFNAAIGYIIHMTIILAQYLTITLPYELVNKGRDSYAQSHHPGLSAQKPLFYTPENVEEFTQGLAMLNFDIAYLCFTQGKLIPLDEVPQTLKNLAECCEASKPRNLNGRYKTANTTTTNNSNGTTNVNNHSNDTFPQTFPLKFSEVLRFHQKIRKEPTAVTATSTSSRSSGGSRPSSNSKTIRPSDEALDRASIIEDDFVVVPNF